MKVLILGAGVIGVTSAWYLARAGHEVIVLDRQPGPALETSFANAGEVSPGYSSPWAAPGVPLKAIKWLFQRHAPLILQPRFDMQRASWMVQMLKNCTSSAYAVNKSRMVRLAEYSRDCMRDLRNETAIQYDERMQGTLQVFRSQKQMDAAAKDIAVLQADGVPFEVLDRPGCVAAEPGLAGSQQLITGGLRLPGDETGDCFKFTNRLAAMAEAAGVIFKWDVEINALESEGDKIAGVRTSEGLLTADRYVLALGPYSPMLVKHLGLNLPIYPLKGYSLTIPIQDESRAPVSTVMDETYKIAITRLGSRIRVGGLAEIAGFDMSLNPRRKETLAKSVNDLFTGGGNTDHAEFWCGLRPMTPDGTPIIGPTHIPNLFLNTGHGTLGWTMAAGSGKLLADLISDHSPEIQAEDLAYGRYVKKNRRAPIAATARHARA